MFTIPGSTFLWGERVFTEKSHAQFRHESELRDTQPLFGCFSEKTLFAKMQRLIKVGDVPRVLGSCMAGETAWEEDDSTWRLIRAGSWGRDAVGFTKQVKLKEVGGAEMNTVGSKESSVATWRVLLERT